MNKKYKVELNEEQKQNLEKITSSGTYPARQIKRAQILLKSDTKVSWSYEQISDAFDVSEVLGSWKKLGRFDCGMVRAGLGGWRSGWNGSTSGWSC